jgi:ferric-dicitrate binding protein FerR (iron transport regulator)
LATQRTAARTYIAIIAAPGTAYRVIAVTVEHTDVIVDHGVVTARLFPGAGHHELVLRGGDVIARATGTVYSLTVADTGVVVSVHEGTVAVHDRAGDRAVPHGTTWPPNAVDRGASAADRLLDLRRPS